MNNKYLQKVYKYIVNNIKEFIIYLQEYVENGSIVDFEVDKNG